MKNFTSLLLITMSVVCSCKEQQEREVVETIAEVTPEMKVTHYYTVKVKDGVATRDTLKNCFSCNQAEVFDENGKQTELRFYKSDMQEMFGYEVYDYNEEGYKIGSRYFEEDSLTTVYNYDIDKDGRIMKGLAFNAQDNELLYGYLNEYDDMGNHFSTGSLNNKEEVVDYYRRKFNDDGVVVTENIEDLDGNPTFEVRYEYRPRANKEWTEQLTYYNDVLSEIRYRETVPLKNQ